MMFYKFLFKQIVGPLCGGGDDGDKGRGRGGKELLPLWEMDTGQTNNANTPYANKMLKKCFPIDDQWRQINEAVA